MGTAVPSALAHRSWKYSGCCSVAAGGFHLTETAWSPDSAETLPGPAGPVFLMLVLKVQDASGAEGSLKMNT